MSPRHPSSAALPSDHRLAISLCAALYMLCALCPVAQAQLKPDDAAAKTYKQAQRLVEEDAARAYELAKSLPKFAYADDMRVRLLSEAALSSGKADEAVGHLLAFAEDADSFERSYTARLDAAEMMILSGDGERARTLLKTLSGQRSKLRGRYSTRRHLGARAVRLLHDVEQGMGNTKIARGLARTLLVFLPSEQSTKRPGLAITPQELSKSQRFARAKNAYNSWSYELARQEFTPFSKDKSRGNEATWYLAQIALNKLRDDFPGAEAAFKRLSRAGYRKPDAMFSWARALMRQERYDEAIDVLDSYLALYPKGTHAQLCRYYKGWLPYDHREHDAAVKGLKAYIDFYGRRGARSSYVYGFLAWTYMRKQAWKDAIKVWDSMMGFGNPIVAGKAMYWKAFALDQLGDKPGAIASLDTLRARYPVSYYGVHGEQLRVLIETGKAARASEVWWPEGMGDYSDAARVDIEDLKTSRLSSANRRAWRRVRELLSLSEDRLARQEYSRVETAIMALTPSAKRDEWVHALGHYVGNYHTMWRIGGRTSIGYLPPVAQPDSLRSVMAYPRAYRDVVEQTAQEFELAEYLVWGIMRQESRYKPSAISHTDAVGALQMIPKTARLVAQDLGIRYNPRTFHYPEVGFRYSGFYMRKLLDTFGGLFTPMAGAYNSGPKVIARWFRRNPQASFPWLIEEFEYNEGRSYSRKVTEHITRYVYMYESDKARRDALLNRLFPLSRDVELPDDVGY